MIRRLLIVALVLTTVGTTGCGKKKGHSNRGSSATVASNGSGTLPTFGSLRNLISVTPAAGPLSGEVALVSCGGTKPISCVSTLNWVVELRRLTPGVVTPSGSTKAPRAPDTRRTSSATTGGRAARCTRSTAGSSCAR